MIPCLGTGKTNLVPTCLANEDGLQKAVCGEEVEVASNYDFHASW